ncbi:hypothetical protein ACLKA7_015927 [Drosophila subpalustris]
MITTPTLSPTGTQDTLKPNPKTVHHNNDGSKQIARLTPVDKWTSGRRDETTVYPKYGGYQNRFLHVSAHPNGQLAKWQLQFQLPQHSLNVCAITITRLAYDLCVNAVPCANVYTRQDGTE